MQSFNAAINAFTSLSSRSTICAASNDECRQLVMEVQCWTVERLSKLESVSPSLPEAHQDAGKADAA